MVRIAKPPPPGKPKPIITTLPRSSEILRIYDPASRRSNALTFRQFGPLHRFDHHRHPAAAPAVDVARGILYGGFSLSCCVVEVFGDTGVIDPGTKCVCLITVKRPLSLLDLRRSAAMRAATVAAVAKDADRNVTQQWARYFYENTGIFGNLDGLLFFNAHNDEESVALFERAADALVLTAGNAIALADPDIKPELQHIAIQNNLLMPPY